MIDKDRSYLVYNYNSAFQHLTGITHFKTKNKKNRQNLRAAKKISSSHECLSRWEQIPHNLVSRKIIFQIRELKMISPKKTFDYLCLVC